MIFPCNQFLSQEPGDGEEIKQFAKKVKGITFDGIFAKVDVNGPAASPLWIWLKESQKGWFGDDIKWSYSKFLINKKGECVARYSPTTGPMSISSDIDKCLQDKM